MKNTSMCLFMTVRKVTEEMARGGKYTYRDKIYVMQEINLVSY